MAFSNFFKQIRDKIDAARGSESDEEPPEQPQSISVVKSTPVPIGKIGLNPSDPSAVNPPAPARRPGDVVPGLKERKKGQPPAKETGIVQNQKDDSAYRIRTEHIAKIEGFFGEFGPKVCSYMLAQSLQNGGIGRVLQKLEMQSRGREQADLTQIENWILRNGIDKFKEIVGIRSDNAPDPSPASVPSAQERVAKNNFRVQDSEAPAPAALKVTELPQPPTGGQRLQGVPIAKPVAPSVVERITTRPDAPSVSASAHTPIPTSKAQAHVRSVGVQPIGLEGKVVERRTRPSSSPSSSSMPKDLRENVSNDSSTGQTDGTKNAKEILGKMLDDED